MSGLPYKECTNASGGCFTAKACLFDCRLEKRDEKMSEAFERVSRERDEHARWRQDLADKLDEVERHRDALAVALNKCSEERDSAIRERDSAKVDLEEVCDTRDRLVDIVERRRKLLERVLQCGLCEEPHGVGFTPSRQERLAFDLARDIGNELRGIDALVKG